MNNTLSLLILGYSQLNSILLYNEKYLYNSLKKYGDYNFSKGCIGTTTRILQIKMHGYFLLL